MQNFTFDELKEILIMRVGLSPDKVSENPDTTFAEMELDSLALVELQLAMQQRYGFEIPDSEASQMTTVGEVVAYTNRRLREGA